MSQEALKSQLGFKDRQTVSDIENGKRSVKAAELLALSEVLDRDVEFFLDPFSAVAEAQYCWRASLNVAGEDLDRFETLANGWIGMLRWLRGQQERANRPLKVSLRLTAHATVEQAQDSAEALVEQFGLGPVPSARLVEWAADELDIPVLFIEPGSRLSHGTISGAACDLGDLGVVFVNRGESRVRRSFNIAHELFHILTWEAMRPDHRESNSMEARHGAKRVEQLADNFVAALLMPRASLDALIGPTQGADAEHLADIAWQLGVTPVALGWRLFNLKRIDAASRDALFQIKRDEDDGPAPPLFSRRFVTMLHSALDRGLLSARKAAKSLGFPLSELTALFATYGMSALFELQASWPCCNSEDSSTQTSASNACELEFGLSFPSDGAWKHLKSATKRLSQATTASRSESP